MIEYRVNISNYTEWVAVELWALNHGYDWRNGLIRSIYQPTVYDIYKEGKTFQLILDSNGDITWSTHTENGMSFDTFINKVEAKEELRDTMKEYVVQVTDEADWKFVLDWAFDHEYKWGGETHPLLEFLSVTACGDVKDPEPEEENEEVARIEAVQALKDSSTHAWFTNMQGDTALVERDAYAYLIGLDACVPQKLDYYITWCIDNVEHKDTISNQLEVLKALIAHGMTVAYVGKG